MDTIETFRRIQYTIDKIIETSELYDGLFPPILDPQTGCFSIDYLKSPVSVMDDGGWSHLGCNLIHDEPLLQIM